LLRTHETIDKFFLLETCGFQPHSLWSKFQNTPIVNDPI